MKVARRFASPVPEFLTVRVRVVPLSLMQFVSVRGQERLGREKIRKELGGAFDLRSALHHAVDRLNTQQLNEERQTLYLSAVMEAGLLSGVNYRIPKKCRNTKCANKNDFTVKLKSPEFYRIIIQFLADN